MSQTVVIVCDGCGGVIPAGAPNISITGGTVTLATSTQEIGLVTFCCTSHLAQFMQSKPNIPVPQPPYPKLPG